MATNNSNNMTNPISVSTGGSGVASTTAYSVLCGGTTSTGAVQFVSGQGSSGQALTSNGASALPTWQNISSGGGDFVLISSTSGSAASSISFTSGFSSTYIHYMIKGDSITTSSNADTFVCEISTNGGSSYVATTYGSIAIEFAASGITNPTATTYSLLYDSYGSTNAGSFCYYIFNVGTTTSMNMIGTCQVPDSSTGASAGSMSGTSMTTTYTMNAIRFRMITGNISGNLSLYGIKT